jgi:hypothetical protein
MLRVVAVVSSKKAWEFRLFLLLHTTAEDLVSEELVLRMYSSLFHG